MTARHAATISVPEALFGPDGNTVAAAELTKPAAELIAVPHAERGNVLDDAQWTIAEAIRLHSPPGTGRIQFSDPARLAIDSLIAQGWTPPAQGADGETARLRTTVAMLRRGVDDAYAYSARAHDGEQKAASARGAMAMMLNNAVFGLRRQAAEANAQGQPEPTLAVTKVADALEKALAKGRR